MDLLKSPETVYEKNIVLYETELEALKNKIGLFAVIRFLSFVGAVYSIYSGFSKSSDLTVIGSIACTMPRPASEVQLLIGPRLKFTIDVPADLRAYAFPPNLLISLVENAIKHGIEPSADGGTIEVRARRDGDKLTVEVADTGRGLVVTESPQGSGVGLANVRERLAALYGSRGRFTLSPLTPRGTRAALEIPIDPQ